jgi:hypothetical protein
MNRIVVTMLAVVVAGAALVVRAQDEGTMLAGFDITLTRTAKGVSLTCAAGCAWKALEFTVGKEPVPINENGMVDPTDNPAKSGRLLLRIGLGKDEFALSCDRGCAWRRLGWQARQDGAGTRVNEYGMAPRK